MVSDSIHFIIDCFISGRVIYWIFRESLGHSSKLLGNNFGNYQRIWYNTRMASTTYGGSFYQRKGIKLQSQEYLELGIRYFGDLLLLMYNKCPTG